MDKEITTFGDAETEKSKFHYSKYLVNISNVDINKITISNKVSLGKKDFNYFIGYKDEGKVSLYA